METNTFSLSPDAFNTHLLSGVIDAICPPGETAAGKQMRSAVIVEMFRAFEAADAMESMIACHCVTLQFVLQAAMCDAGNINLDPVMLTRMRASAMTISKTLHLWMTKYEKIHARNEARAAEALTLAEQPVATVAAPQQDPVRQPPMPEESPPIAAEPTRPENIRAPLDTPHPGLPPITEALPRGASSNGRLTETASVRGT